MLLGSTFVRELRLKKAPVEAGRGLPWMYGVDDRKVRRSKGEVRS